MWEDNVINIVRSMKIVKSFTITVDKWGNWVDIETIYTSTESPEANRFRIKPYKNNKGLFL